MLGFPRICLKGMRCSNLLASTITLKPPKTGTRSLAYSSSFAIKKAQLGACSYASVSGSGCLYVSSTNVCCLGFRVAHLFLLANGSAGLDDSVSFMLTLPIWDESIFYRDRHLYCPED